MYYTLLPPMLFLINLYYFMGKQLFNRNQKFFETIDVNNDQYVDKNELQAYLKKNGVPTSPALIKSILNEFNCNQSGKIKKQAFLLYAQQKQKNLKNLFNQFDYNKSGYIDKQDLKVFFNKMNIQTNQQTIKQMIRKIDYNQSGHISFQEFLYFYYLIPAANIKHVFDHWARGCTIDIGQTSMTIPHQETSKGKQAFITLLSGAVAGAFSRTTTAPLDRLKVIMQAQTKGKSQGILQGFKNIYKQGGIKAFFRGNGTNVLKIIPQTAIKFLGYDKIKSFICKDIKAPTTFERLVSGGLAGFVSQTCIYPMQIAKTRLALADKGLYNGIFDCFKKISTKQGIRGLYAGWGASVIGIIPYASIDLTVFSFLRDTYIKRMEEEPKVMVLLMSGAFSGICGQSVSYPLALIRTRLQSQGLPGREKQYDGMLDCFRKIIKSQGMIGLYRGILPNFMKSVPAISISYAVFQTCKKSLTSY